MRPSRIQCHARQQPADLAQSRRMAEDRQPERRLGNKHVARHRHERLAGRIRRALVVPAYHGAAAAIRHHDLRRAQHMPRRFQPQRHLAHPDPLAPARRLACLARHAARLHDRQRCGMRQHRAMPAAGMVRMPMGDHRSVDCAQRVDEKPARFAKQPLRPRIKPRLGMGRAHRLAGGWGGAVIVMPRS